ncbi:MAG: toast rack family protein, partial [Anaerolineaceae bacterium]
MKPTLILVTMVLLASTLACGISVNVPSVQTGPTQTLDINETLPAGSGVTELTIEMAAGKLNIEPASDKKLSGRVDYNVNDWMPTITTD